MRNQPGANVLFAECGADREISAIIDQEGRAAPHDQVRFEEIGAWIGVARHAVRSAELGRAQDVA